jgi:HAD superfamily hydrolase (TIGR01549 family)
MYTSVIFDVGSTLIDFTRPEPFRRFLQDIQPGRRVTMAEGRALLERWSTLFRQRRHLARGLGAGNDDLTRFWRSFVVEICTDLPQPEKVAGELWQRFDRGELQQLYADVRPALSALRRLGVPMAIISNFRPDLEDYLKRLRIRGYFRFVICSSLVGLAKPDRRIFELAVQKAGVPAGQILYVGDDLSDDVAGSQNAGLTPVLIDRGNWYPDARCLRIQSLLDVVGLVQSPQ